MTALITRAGDIAAVARDCNPERPAHVGIGGRAYPASGVHRSERHGLVVETDLVPVYSHGGIADPEVIWSLLLQTVQVHRMRERSDYNLRVRVGDAFYHATLVEVDPATGDWVVRVPTAIRDDAVALFKANVRKMFA